MKLLVIDDDRELGELIRDYLAPLGYETTLERDGPAGIERALSGEKFCAVILDVMLPGGLDGFEVLRRRQATVAQAAVTRPNWSSAPCASSPPRARPCSATRRCG